MREEVRMQYVVKYEATINVAAVDGTPFDEQAIRVAIEEHLDDVMEELLVLGAGDPAISGDMAQRTVTMEVLVDAKSPVAATAQASGLLRTAIHAAGGHTPDWPNEDASVWSVELMDISATLVNA
jgi:hypothetical protein